MKKIILSGLVILGVLGAVATSVVLAKNPQGLGIGRKLIGTSPKPGFEAMLENKADLLGISVDELREKVKQGKTFREIVGEHELTIEEFCEKNKEKMGEWLQQLVDEGKITEEEMNEKIETMEERCLENAGNGPINNSENGLKIGHKKEFQMGFRAGMRNCCENGCPVDETE